MEKVLTLSVFVVLLTVCLLGFFLVLRALFSSRVAQTQFAVQSMSGRSLLVGAVNFLFFGVIALILASIGGNTYGVMKAVLLAPVLFLLGVLTVGLSFGLAGMVQVVGERILPEHTAWNQSMWGTVALSLACAVPMAGWFLLLPYAALTGLGAFILSFFTRPQAVEK